MAENKEQTKKLLENPNGLECYGIKIYPLSYSSQYPIIEPEKEKFIIFVSNVNLQTDEEKIRNFFTCCEKIKKIENVPRISFANFLHS